MTGDNVTKLNIANNLVEKIANFLNAEVQRSLLVDHKGVEKEKYQSYTRRNNDTGINLF